MSFITTTRAAAALPTETNESSAGTSQHQGNEKNTLSPLLGLVIMSFLLDDVGP